MDGSARIFEVETGSEVSRLRGHNEPVYALLWSLDGSRLFTASRDFTIRVWDPQTWTDLTYFDAHDEYVYGLTPHPDGQTIFSCGGDGTVRRWGPKSLPELMEERGRYRAAVKKLEPLLDSQGLEERTDLSDRERQIARQLLWAQGLD